MNKEVEQILEMLREKKGLAHQQLILHKMSEPIQIHYETRVNTIEEIMKEIENEHRQDS